MKPGLARVFLQKLQNNCARLFVAAFTGTRAVAYDDTGTSYQSGWLTLCADDSVDAKVELGANDCGDDGPCCGGGWTKVASWHVSSGCDGAAT